MTKNQKGSAYVMISGILYGLLGYLGMNIINHNIALNNMLFWRFLITSFMSPRNLSTIMTCIMQDYLSHKYKFLLCFKRTFVVISSRKLLSQDSSMVSLSD